MNEVEDMLVERESIAALGGTIKQIQTQMVKMNQTRDRLALLVEKYDALTYKMESGLIAAITLTVTDKEGGNNLALQFPTRGLDQIAALTAEILLKEIQITHSALMHMARELGEGT